MDIEDFFNGGMLTTVQDIFANRLWQSGDHNANSVYVTQVARPIHVGGRFPLDPSEKEWYFTDVNTTYYSTNELFFISTVWSFEWAVTIISLSNCIDWKAKFVRSKTVIHVPNTTRLPPLSMCSENENYT